MKRTERRHLKEHELKMFARQAWETFEERRREALAVIAIVAVIAIAAIGYYGWRQHVQAKAHSLLAEALAVRDARVGPPPAPGTPSTGGPGFATERERAQAGLMKFKVVADAYPSTDAGLYARYQQAATYMSLENPTQAAATYQQVVDRAGSNSIYGQMARLGVAEAQTRAGQYDQAINTFKELSMRKDGPLPVDGILMQLGRTYLVAGKRADAQQTFNRLVEEFPESPYTSDARRELENLRKT
jgi:predicted Zn-dependent protease